MVLTREPSRAWIPFTAVGARAVLSHARPSTAVSHRLGLASESIEAGAALTLGVTDVWSDPIAELLVRRHVLGAFGGWRLKLGEELTATVDVHSGVALFMRSTRPRASFLCKCIEGHVHGHVVRKGASVGPLALVGARPLVPARTSSSPRRRSATRARADAWSVRSRSGRFSLIFSAFAGDRSAP